MKLTPWFPPEIKPAYPGVYQVKGGGMIWYRFWDGEYWYHGSTTVYKAACETTPYPFEINPWRGLAKPPKGWTK